MANSEYKQYLVWSGCEWWPTWAVSEAKAISNIVWRMRQMGKFPVRSAMEVRLVEPVGNAMNRKEGVSK